MKKTFLLLILLVALSGCTPQEPIVTLESFIETIQIPTSTLTDLVLPEEYVVNGDHVIAIWTSNNEDIISSAGEVNQGIYDEEIDLHLYLSSTTENASKSFTVLVPGYGLEAFLTDALHTLVMPLTTKINITFPRALSFFGETLELSWSSANTAILSNTGRVTIPENDTVVTITVITEYDKTEATRDFDITIIGLTAQEKIDITFEEATPPSYVTEDITLPTTFNFSLTGTWTSSHPDIISEQGVVNPTLSGQHTVILTLTLNSNDRRTYSVIVSKLNHMVIDRTFAGIKTDIEVESNQLVLSATALTGEYNTGIINTLSFTSAVASWAAVSSENATVELQIQVLVGSIWSRYFSYGEWGKGRENKSYNASDTVASLSADELIIANSQKATAIRVKLTLRRTTLTDPSPRVSLIACALEIPGYQYPVDISSLPTQIDYDVPKLYQHVVPTIGGIICSATSSTMLLKYKGHDFSSIDTLEHRYIAGIVREYNSGIYGNWVYNTVGISSFGEVSYVKRMYSYQELLHHLATVGPIAASVKGTMVGELVKTWTTSGHLIVIRGYRWQGDQLYILANDPNLSTVYEEYKIENFMNVWRNIAYVIE
ncbi:MAG: immunoglobulin-like domain-containing protein [Bacilli bacterium]